MVAIEWDLPCMYDNNTLCHHRPPSERDWMSRLPRLAIFAYVSCYFKGAGRMIEHVTHRATVFLHVPHKWTRLMSALILGLRVVSIDLRTRRWPESQKPVAVKPAGFVHIRCEFPPNSFYYLSMALHVILNVLLWNHMKASCKFLRCLINFIWEAAVNSSTRCAL